jgi:hypothetical protein
MTLTPVLTAFASWPLLADVITQHPALTQGEVQIANQLELQHQDSSHSVPANHHSLELLDLSSDPLISTSHASYLPSLHPPSPATFFCLPPVNTAAAQQHIAAIRLAWEDLCNLRDAEVRATTRHGSIDQLIADTISSLPDPEAFRAGGLHRQAPALAAYFSLTTNTSKDAKTVLKIATNGLKLQCIPASDPRQTSIPNFAKKTSIVQQMLQQATSPFSPQQLLNAAQPQQVQFPNHKSAFTYSQFVKTEITSMLQKDVVKVNHWS